MKKRTMICLALVLICAVLLVSCRGAEHHGISESRSTSDGFDDASALQTDPLDVTTDGEGDSDSVAPLAGKTIVCFGDSIFGMHRDSSGVPAVIAAQTGATVYNVGFGGCRMAVHPSTGYNEFCMWALADAVASGDWSAQDAAVSDGSSHFPDQLALLKSIDFSTVDIAVIHYGTNDFFGWGNALDNPDDPDDYTTVCGALRYSLDKLMTAYPNLQIYISLPLFRYWTADDGTIEYSDTYINKIGYTFDDGCAAIAEVARAYDLPVIDGYNGLGIDATNAATFLDDGTHLNTEGRKRFGSFIASCLTDGQNMG